ncbi:MAG: hypothetical protein ACFFC6_01545 [Promethearchaeota archaeon]
MSRSRIGLSGFLIALILSSVPSVMSEISSNKGIHNINISDPIITDYNRYIPDGNCSVLLALDTNLLGEENYFSSEQVAKQLFKSWLKPFEDRFGLNFHIMNVTPFTPGKNDNLTVSMEKIPIELSWNLAAGVNADDVEGNGYDWLLIYQKYYGGGRNQANAINGNALIIAHDQLIFDRQLILLHEVGHLFGGVHDTEGNVNPNWYQGEVYSIMDYWDLIELDDKWDGQSLPLDKVNFNTMNATKYRFDQKDPELDGLPNYYEYRYGLDPTINDSYHDYDNDGLLNLEEYQYGTNPRDKDSDRDGFSDWAENYLEISPINSSEFPEVNVPIILPWISQKIINEKEPFNLIWRGISSNPSYYELFQNESLLIHNSWEDEVIQYQLENPTPGIWNYTCYVVDTDGDTSKSEILLQIRSVSKTTIILLGPLFGIVCLIYFRKRILKQNE